MSKYKFFEYGYINKATDEWGYVAPPPMSDDFDGLNYVVAPPVPEDNLDYGQSEKMLKPLSLKTKLARFFLKAYRKSH
jgi:hypothetical protein